MTENCTATEDSPALSIGDRGAAFAVPSGWKFAKQSDRTVAVSAEGKSLLAAVEISLTTDAAILASLSQLTLALGIEKVNFEKLKKRFSQPQLSVDAKDTKVSLWEVSKGTSNRVDPELHEQGAGTLLVFVARSSADRVITGFGFVVTPEAEPDAKKIMTAVQSLRLTP